MSVCFPSCLMDDNFQLPFPDAWSPLKFVSNLPFLLITLPTVLLVFLPHTVLVTSDNVFLNLRCNLHTIKFTLLIV